LTATLWGGRRAFSALPHQGRAHCWGSRSVAFLTILRAIWGYCFLIFIARTVGRRPGKQLTPFEFVLVFYLGGLTLTGMVGDELSMTNAVCQIMTVAGVHWVITILRARFPRIGKVLDGTPLVLLQGGYWRSETMRHMRISQSDVMTMARDSNVRTLSDIDTATLERNGEISIIKKQD
jgi:uncharacterized membrane protein YcaP (DUF421 family)